MSSAGALVTGGSLFLPPNLHGPLHMIATAEFQLSGRFKDGEFKPAAHGRITVSLRDAGGKLCDRFEVQPATPRSRAKVAKLLGIGDPEVLELCEQTRSGHPVVYTAATPGAQRGTVTVTIREFESPKGEDHSGAPLELLKQHLPTVPADRLLCWKDKEALVCLDVDYHEDRPPLRAHLETWVETRVAPKPVAWHFSRGGGLHLFYVATGAYTARELASAAALRYRQLDPTAGLELKSQVRGPGAEPVSWYPPDTGGAASSLPGGGREADEEAVEQYLTTHGMEQNGRYPHDRCPIDPGGDAQRDPVTVSPLGIYCHRCAGKGLTLGSRRPGFVPWAVLTGSPSGSDVGSMIRNMVHWGHARWVLTHKYELPEDLARDGYAAALKAHHGDALTPGHLAAVFNPDTLYLARSGDKWMNLEDGYNYPATTSTPLLAALPTALVVTDKGLKASASSVAYLNQGHDLTNRGYSNIEVVHGFRLARQYLPPPPRTMVSILTKCLRGSPRAPKYVPKSKRMPIKEAEAVFQRWFPLIDLQAVRALVCAQAVAQETRLGLHPMLFITGHTGAAKTTTVKIAAGITGTNAPEIAFTTNEERLKQSIAQASASGSFALANEFLKDCYRQTRRYDPRQTLEPFLNVTPESQNHVMFTGPRRLGRLPAIVVTEPNCPYAIHEYQQISRRFYYLHLHGDKSVWKERLAELGVTTESLHTYRVANADLAAAADAILSDLIDRYFCLPMTWDAIAGDLGVKTILESEHFEDQTPAALRFFRLVADAPEITDPRLAKDYGPGYKLIHRTDTPTEQSQELSDCWSLFADTTFNGWSQSQLLLEKNWASILKVSEPVHLDIKARGANMVFVRFRVGPPRSPLLLNGAITAGAKETP